LQSFCELGKCPYFEEAQVVFSALTVHFLLDNEAPCASGKNGLESLNSCMNLDWYSEEEEQHALLCHGVVMLNYAGNDAHSANSAVSQ